MASTSGSSNSLAAVTAPGVTYIYLAKGFFEALAHAGRTIDDLANGMGFYIDDLADGMGFYSSELKFCDHLADMADIVEETWTKVRRDYTGGTWDRKVTEPFGKLLANHLALHHTLPSNDEARAMVLNIVKGA